ncbi:MAG: HEPN domain-containing protein [Bacteroidales bacterium]|nr:HEPN domain-containing protein [Bacteroidales bacterium]
MKYYCNIKLNNDYRFSKEILNFILPLEINTINGIVNGKLIMPNRISNRDLYFENDSIKMDIVYLGTELESFFLINAIYCEFELEKNDELDLYYGISNKLYSLSNILRCYPKNILDKCCCSDNKINKIDFKLFSDDGKEIKDQKLYGVGYKNEKDCIDIFIIRRILLLLKYNAKPSITYQLLNEAKDMEDNNDYRHAIINCCTICEIVFSKLLVDKLTKNGSKKNDIEKILNNINGIAALGKLLKEFEIKTIKADFGNLAGLRNKSAHMGILPNSEDCSKYIKVCEELLKYHRIKFYKIEKS